MSGVDREVRRGFESNNIQICTSILITLGKSKMTVL